MENNILLKSENLQVPTINIFIELQQTTKNILEENLLFYL